MLLKYCFPLKLYKKNQISPIRQVAVKISIKFDLFYNVWAQKIILKALGEFRTPIWYTPNSNHSYHF